MTKASTMQVQVRNETREALGTYTFLWKYHIYHLGVCSHPTHSIPNTVAFQEVNLVEGGNRQITPIASRNTKQLPRRSSDKSSG